MSDLTCFSKLWSVCGVFLSPSLCMLIIKVCCLKSRSIIFNNVHADRQKSLLNIEKEGCRWCGGVIWAPQIEIGDLDKRKNLVLRSYLWKAQDQPWFGAKGASRKNGLSGYQTNLKGFFRRNNLSHMDRFQMTMWLNEFAIIRKPGSVEPQKIEASEEDYLSEPRRINQRLPNLRHRMVQFWICKQKS